MTWTSLTEITLLQHFIKDQNKQSTHDKNSLSLQYCVNSSLESILFQVSDYI